METQNETQNCINAKTLGQKLQLSKRQIFRLNSCRKIPAPLKIGGAIRWDSHIIERWISLGCPDRREFEARLKEDNANDHR
jgi:prophage regulatory protein